MPPFKPTPHEYDLVFEDVALQREREATARLARELYGLARTPLEIAQADSDPEHIKIVRQTYHDSYEIRLTSAWVTQAPEEHLGEQYTVSFRGVQYQECNGSGEFIYNDKEVNLSDWKGKLNLSEWHNQPVILQMRVQHAETEAGLEYVSPVIRFTPQDTNGCTIEKANTVDGKTSWKAIPISLAEDSVEMQTIRDTLDLLQ
jgi:hypothetical protein